MAMVAIYILLNTIGLLDSLFGLTLVFIVAIVAFIQFRRTSTFKDEGGL
ncbi:Maltodextrin transport system permease protein malD [Staphylococcus aureus]|nr:Maltodextrin transport system permease protein malD [Staphylococcus aureus]